MTPRKPKTESAKTGRKPAFYFLRVTLKDKVILTRMSGVSTQKSGNRTSVPAVNAALIQLHGPAYVERGVNIIDELRKAEARAAKSKP